MYLGAPARIVPAALERPPCPAGLVGGRRDGKHLDPPVDRLDGHHVLLHERHAVDRRAAQVRPLGQRRP